MRIFGHTVESKEYALEQEMTHQIFGPRPPWPVTHGLQIMAFLFLSCHCTIHVYDFGRRAFSYSSPAICNFIPASIENCSSLYSFRRHLKSHLIARSFFMFLICCVCQLHNKEYMMMRPDEKWWVLSQLLLTHVTHLIIATHWPISCSGIHY